MNWEMLFPYFCFLLKAAILAEKPIRHRYCIDLFREMAPHLHKSDEVWHMRTKI